MIDKALSGLNPVQNQGQSYYFQLYPLSLTIVGEQSTVPAQGTTYRFTILKGQQKFDETKLPIEANYKRLNGVSLMVMPKCPINFYTPTFNKNRKTEFQFQMYQYEQNNEYFIADYIIDIEPYITQYKNQRTVRFEHRSKFSDDYELEFEIYLEKSRFALEKVVKDYKHERSLKSPLRERKQPSPSALSPRLSPSRVSPSRKNLVDEQIPRKQIAESKEQISQSAQNFLDEPQRSTRDDSKKMFVTNSRNVSSVIQAEVEDRAMPKRAAKSSIVSQSEAEQKREETKIKQKSANVFPQKQIQQASSGSKVPIIASKLKPLKDVSGSEVKMKESQRMGSKGQAVEERVQAVKKQQVNARQKIVMALFLTVSIFVMYLSMHPNRRV